MIEYNQRIRSMLLNILEQTSIIYNDFELNNAVHYEYILEKLKKAQWDLNILISSAEDFKKESKTEDD